jgi:hypothetical protein
MAPLTVLEIFTEYVRRKYDELPVASSRIQMLNAIPATLPPEAQLAMDATDLSGRTQTGHQAG